MVENRNIIYVGDNKDLLGKVEDESIQLTLTSPPYFNAKHYSTYDTYEGYMDEISKAFAVVYDKTESGRFLIVQTSPVITKRVNRSEQSQRHAVPFDLHGHLIEIGWEFIDDIVWVRPTGASVGRNRKFKHVRRPLTYKADPITEYIMVYRKNTGLLIDENIAKYDLDRIRKSMVWEHIASSNVWHFNPEKHVVHPAVFPPKLVETILKCYTHVDDLVLDPYAGIGTVGKIARQLERNFILIEKSTTYANHMLETWASPQLFGEDPIWFTTK